MKTTTKENEKKNKPCNEKLAFLITMANNIVNAKRFNSKLSSRHSCLYIEYLKSISLMWRVGSRAKHKTILIIVLFLRFSLND